MQSDAQPVKNWALYLNGRRIAALENFSYSSADELTIGDGEVLKPTTFTIKISVGGRDLERFWSMIERLCPASERKKHAATYRRAVRRNLVRYAGTAGAPMGRVSLQQRKVIESLGVRIPRSLR